MLKYKEKFTSLSRFAFTLMADEGNKCRWFLKGLHPTIESHLSIFKIIKYADLIDCAIITERDLPKSQTAQDKKYKRNYQDGSPDRGTNKQDGQS